MILRIDGSDIARLVVNDREFAVGPEGYLAAIASVVEPAEITAIEVVAGPGSATALRASLAIANTLAWTLGVPINGRSMHVEPVYEHAARITPSGKDQLRRKI